MKITIDQVIEKFDKKIERVIQNFNLLNVEDIKQDIYMDMVRRGYLIKYDPKYAMSTFVYTFVRNHCRNARRNLFFKKRRGRMNTLSLDYPIKKEKGQFDKYFTLQDILPAPLTLLKDIETNNFVNRLTEEVANKKVYFIATSKKRKISLKKVIDLLVMGYNIKEIARKLKVSDLTVTRKFKRLSSKTWIRDYYNIDAGNNDKQRRRQENLGLPSKL